MPRFAKIFSLVWILFLDFSDSKRIRRSELEGSTLIVCEGGKFTSTCPSGTSVNVTIADYGRTSNENICALTGYPGREICRSTRALKLAHAHCAASTTCRMKVNAENLGRPVKDDGFGCFDTSKYLKLVYTCVRDCRPPIFNYNSEVVGKEYHVTSKVTVQCREGYERIDGQVGGVEKTCMDDQTWFGPTLLCRDFDECSNPSGNRCHSFALCQNTRGSYSCTCINGYYGDGITCTAESWFKGDDWSDANSNQTGTTQEDDWDQALIAVHDEKICGKRITKGRQGILKSPRYPLKYPSNAACIWVIAVPPELVVELRFMKFELERERANEGCSQDNVTLYDGLNKDPTWWLGTFCGDELPATIMSQTNKVRIEFSSDHTAQFSGFEIRYSAINLNSACLNFPAPSYTGIVLLNGTRNSTTQPRKTLLLGCADGYVMTSQQSLIRTCQDNGKWNDYSNPCSPISCGRPLIPVSSKGLVVRADPARFRYGERPIRYECETGYRIMVDQGYDDVIVCDRKGRWSNERHGLTPSCEEITCVCQTDVTCAANDGAPEPSKALRWFIRDQDGEVVEQPVGRTFAYGSRIQYSCADGYVLNGDDVRLCTEDGWSGRRTVCEEAPFAGLTNFHIAVIASATSGFVILLITIALVICCCRDHKKKKKKKQQNRLRHMRAARDNNGFVMNLALAGNDDFLYGNTVDRRGRKNGFAGKHNNIRKYQNHPHVIPNSASSSSHPQITPTGQPRPLSYQFGGEIRPNGNTTFRPSQHRNVTPPQSGHRRTPSSTRMTTPPPGYQDPPPSYNTTVREGYSQFDKKKRGKR